MSSKKKGIAFPMNLVISSYLSKHEEVEWISPSRLNFKEGTPYSHKNSNAFWIHNRTRERGCLCCLLTNVITWNTKVPILNTWAFLGDKGKLRQKTEIPSLVSTSQRLREWVHNHVVSWPEEQMGQRSPWLPPAATWTWPVPAPGLDMSAIGKTSHLGSRT
jgi:hypothetical protein